MFRGLKFVTILTGRKFVASILACLFCVELLSKGLWFSLLTGTSPGEFHSHPLLDAEVYDYVVVVCMGKSEGKYLKEWVEHNRRVGVDKIVYYDDTPHGKEGAALPLLQDYVDNGFVEIHDATKWDNRSFIFATEFSMEQGSLSAGSIFQHLFYDKQQKMQVDMWRRFHDDRNSSRHVWIAQLDVDEFYNPREGAGKEGTDDIKTVLRSARMQGAKSVRAAKVEFGPSGNLYPQPTIRDSYLVREAIYERHTGFALAWAITGMAPGCPHVYITNSFLFDVARGSHECNNWFGDKYGGEVYYSPPTELAVHHYNTKSILECYERSEIPHPDGKIVGRHCLGYKYKVCDDSILRFLDKYHSYSSQRKKPCGINNGSAILDKADQMRFDLLSRRKFLDVLDICTKKSISGEEKIACGIKRPGPNYKGYVPNLNPDHFYREGGEEKL